MPRVWEAQKASMKPSVLINGQSVEIDPATQDFATTIKQLAAARGLAKFTVVADGREIKTHNVPRNFCGLKSIVVKKYDEAA